MSKKITADEFLECVDMGNVPKFKGQTSFIYSENQVQWLMEQYAQAKVLVALEKYERKISIYYADQYAKEIPGELKHKP